MPQITAYVNKADHARWMRVERKADAIKWLLDRYEAGDIKLPKRSLTIKTGFERGVDVISDSTPDMQVPKPIQPRRVIKTAEDAKKAVAPITPHENFLKKPTKK